MSQSEPRGRGRLVTMMPQETRLRSRPGATTQTVATPAVVGRSRNAEQNSADEMLNMKQRFQKKGLRDRDAEFDKFVSESRQRFQQMLTGDPLSSRLPAFGDGLKDRLGGPTGRTSNNAGDRLAFNKARPALLDDSETLNTPGSSIFKDSPLRNSDLLGGSPTSLLSRRPPLSQRLNMTMLDDGFEPTLSPLGGTPSLLSRNGTGSLITQDGPKSLMSQNGPRSLLLRNGSDSLLSQNGSGSLLARNGSGSIVSEMEPGSLKKLDSSLTPSGSLCQTGMGMNVKRTVQTCSTTTTLTSRGLRNGGVDSVTHVQREEQREQSTSDGLSGLQQTRAQKVETATISNKNGKTEVDAKRSELEQQRTARKKADGSAEVSENIKASTGIRKALLGRTNSGSQRVEEATGEDCDANINTTLRINSTGDVTRTGSQVVPYGGDRQVAGPLWRFFDGGQLIQPPGMKIRGKVQVQATRKILNYKHGQQPSIKSDELAYEDSFGGSESESDDDDIPQISDSARRALPSSSPHPRLHRQVPWKSKPALPAPSSSPLSTSPRDVKSPSKLALPWRHHDDTQTSQSAASSPSSVSGVNRALGWRQGGRPVSLAPSEASSDGGAELETAEDVTEEARAARKRRLQKIATELLTSERRYVRELHLIDEVFRARVEEANRLSSMFESDVPAQMFSNIHSIHLFHRDHLLPKLEQRLKTWDTDPRIGDIMKQSAPFLKMYTEFVSGFSTSSSLIAVHQTKTPRFAAVMDEIHTMEECANLPLEHHMITPVQRIPRYELLLKDYIKNLSEDSPDRPDTQRALELVTLAARHSNDTMKRNEKFKKLLEIQENISGGPDLVSPHRELVKEGKIMKISARSGDHQERYLFLFTDLVLLCSARLINSRIISGPAYRLRAKFTVEGLQVMEGDNLETLNTFYLCGNQKNVELYTQSPDEKAEWLEALCGVVRGFYERRASIRPPGGQTSELQPVKMAPLESSSRCCRCDAVFSVIRRKHNCRACGEVVCGRCSGQKCALPSEQGREARVCDLCHQRLSSARQERPRASQTVLDASYSRHTSVLAMPASEPGVQSGELQLRCRRGATFTHRFFCLRSNNVLYMYESEKSRRALAATPVPGFTVTWAGAGKGEPGVADKDKTFRLSFSSRSYTFMAESRDAAARWISALQKACRAEIPNPASNQ